MQDPLDALTCGRFLCPHDGFAPGGVALGCSGPDHVKSSSRTYPSGLSRE